MKRIIRIEKGNEPYGFEVWELSYDTAGKLKQLTHGEKKFIFHYLPGKILIKQEGKEEQSILELTDGQGVNMISSAGQFVLKYEDQRLVSIKHSIEQSVVIESFRYTDNGQLQKYSWQKGNQRIQKTCMYNQKVSQSLCPAVVLNWLIDFEYEWTFLFMNSAYDQIELPDVIGTSLSMDGEEVNRSEIILNYEWKENLMEVVFKKKEEAYGYARFFYE